MRATRTKHLLINTIVFAFGCSFVVVPAFYQASLINANETARGEQTMSPGIHMFVGMIFAPIGGFVAIAAWSLVRYLRKQR